MIFRASLDAARLIYDTALRCSAPLTCRGGKWCSIHSSLRTPGPDSISPRAQIEISIDNSTSDRVSLVQTQTAPRRISSVRVLETSISYRCRVRRSFRATSARRRELLSLTFASAARLRSVTSIAAMLPDQAAHVLPVVRVDRADRAAVAR